LLVIFATAMAAGCASEPPKNRDIDEQAEPVFRKMCDTLDGAKSFRFRVNATIDRPVETGQLAQFNRTSDIMVQRPDGLFSKTESDDGEWTVWYAGTSLTVLDRTDNVYATEKVPAGIAKMLDYLADNYDVIMPMADLLVGKTHESLLADVESGEYLGLHEVGDTSCHHLLFRQENIDWQIWIDAGKLPLPRKLVITYTQEPDQPQYVATMNDWDLAPSITKQTFAFAPPPGAKAVPMSDLVAED
jgi:hypothetical protein